MRGCAAPMPTCTPSLTSCQRCDAARDRPTSRAAVCGGGWTHTSRVPLPRCAAQVSKVLLGASSMLLNGTLVARAGTALVRLRQRSLPTSLVPNL
eukprot:1620792-Prymnesium_polylepis.1